jgi:hypothetical protein
MSLPTAGCPGCGVELPEVTGPAHPYLLGSAACWAGYGDLLAAQYGDPQRMAFHQLVVDAYAVQHPGRSDDRRAVQSVGIHLMTLQLFLEEGVDPALGSSLHRRMVERPLFRPLAAPAARGHRTFRSVPLSGAPGEVRSAAFAWAGDAWAAWSVHHDVVRGWIRRSGLAPGG